MLEWQKRGRGMHDEVTSYPAPFFAWGPAGILLDTGYYCQRHMGGWYLWWVKVQLCGRKAGRWKEVDRSGGYSRRGRHKHTPPTVVPPLTC